MRPTPGCQNNRVFIGCLSQESGGQLLRIRCLVVARGGSAESQFPLRPVRFAVRGGRRSVSAGFDRNLRSALRRRAPRLSTSAGSGTRLLPSAFSCALRIGRRLPSELAMSRRPPSSTPAARLGRVGTTRVALPLAVLCASLLAAPACQSPGDQATQVAPVPALHRSDAQTSRPRDASAPAVDVPATGEVASAPATSSPDVPICTEAICCVGPGCPKRLAGQPCQAADQCETGSCADGVCCNVDCRGACMACNHADRMGECLPVAAGDPDPHLLCRQDPPESCGQSGVCNGQGGCAKIPAGAPCSEPRCGGATVMMPASECNGEGACVPGNAVPCAPFQCDGTGCRATCTDDGQCLPPAVCVNGSCGKRGRGQNCTAPDQCETGFCVDGVCCDGACRGRCLTCASSKSRGICTPVAAGTQDPRAATAGASAAEVCTDQGAASCGTNGRCDGKGGCELYRNGTSCAPGACDGGNNSAVAGSVCRAGRCEKPEARTCAPFVGCAGARCSTSCTTDKDCVAGTVCNQGSCGKRPIGSLCSRNDECAAPGLCAQGRCCSSACTAACMACNLEGSFGKCEPVPAGGADPAGSCRDDACNNGCDGAGNCRRENEGTVCGASSCSADTTIVSKICSAKGACQDVSASCPSGQSCQKDRCLPPAKKLPGAICAMGSDCQSGACLAGRCCAASCNGPCRTCNAESNWRCTDRPDETNCGTRQICKTGRCISQCAAGQILCGAACVNLSEDADNCGACGKSCEARLCVKGVCAPTLSCPSKLLRCAGSCVDTLTSALHCGACDKPCTAPNIVCMLGKCVRAATMPPGNAPPGGAPPANPPGSPPANPPGGSPPANPPGGSPPANPPGTPPGGTPPSNPPGGGNPPGSGTPPGSMPPGGNPPGNSPGTMQPPGMNRDAGPPRG